MDLVSWGVLWAAGTLLLTIFFALIINLFIADQPPALGDRAIEAAVLTVGAEQQAIDRNGQYLDSAAALEAYQPRLGPYFISGGHLDEYQISGNRRALSVEYQSDRGAIRLAFLDGNLVAVTCNENVDDCPSAAELYQRARVIEPGTLNRS